MTNKQIISDSPADVRQAILQYFIAGGKIRPDDYRRLTGFGVKQADGSYRGMREFRSHFWALSKKAGPIDTIYERLEAYGLENSGAMDLTNLVIDTLLTYGGKKRMSEAYSDQVPEPDNFDGFGVINWTLEQRLEAIGLSTKAEIADKAINDPGFLTIFPGGFSAVELALIRSEYCDLPKAEPAKIKAQVKAEKRAGVIIEPYSEKSFIIYGQTYEHRQMLKSLGARFNKFLTVNGERVAGWIAGVKTAEKIKIALSV